MPPPHDVSQAVEFATLLWGPKMPDGLYLQVWAKWSTKSHSSYLEHWVGLDGIVATHRNHDLYVGCSAVAKKLSATVRGKAKDAAAICGLWADLDVAASYADSTEQAIEAAHSLAEPSALVNSGGGVHAWWLFDEPWIFASEDERVEAAQLAEAWVEALRQKVKFKLDSVGELARVLRLPGSYNQKQEPERPVELLSTAGVTFPRASLAELAGPRRRPRAAALNGLDESADVEMSDDVPWEALRRIRDFNEVFDRTWTMQRRDATAKAWSASQWDQSVMSQLVAGGMPDVEAIAATRQFRREHGDEKDKLNRPDYWQRTLRKAKSGSSEQHDASAKREEEDLVTELHELSATPAAAVETTRPDRWAKLNQLTGGGSGSAPRIVEWHQYGTDPNTAAHVWVLDNGIDAPIGTMGHVLDQKAVKRALATVSNIFRPGQWKAATWELGIQTVLPLRTFHADPESEREQRALEWVSMVIGTREVEANPDHVNEAIIARHPFVRDGRLHFTLNYLGGELRRQRIAPDVKDADLPPLLRAAGFVRAPANYEPKPGERTTRSYWSIDESLLS